MRPELQVKFLHHLNKRQSILGFTLVELLVVIVIIGILTAVALPTFLSQSAKARQAEAKQNISAINRAQSYRRADSSSFASTFEELALGTLSGTGTSSTASFIYSMTGTADSGTAAATSKDTTLKSYSAAVLRYTNNENLSIITSTICENLNPGVAAAASVTIGGSNLTCPATTTILK